MELVIGGVYVDNIGMRWKVMSCVRTMKYSFTFDKDFNEISHYLVQKYSDSFGAIGELVIINANGQFCDCNAVPTENGGNKLIHRSETFSNLNLREQIIAELKNEFDLIPKKKMKTSEIVYGRIYAFRYIEATHYLFIHNGKLYRTCGDDFESHFYCVPKDKLDTEFDGIFSGIGGLGVTNSNTITYSADYELIDIYGK